MKQISALSKVFLSETLDNKFVFIFNLILPVVFFLTNNTQRVTKVLTEDFLIEQLSLYWGYIIIVSILNSLILNVVIQKELGIYLEYTLISRSKYQVFIALALVKLGMIFAELLIFNGLVLVMFPKLGLIRLLEITFLGAVVSISVTSLFTVLLLLKVNDRTFSVLEIILIFAIFILDGIKKIPEFIALINPLSYLRQIFMNSGSLVTLLVVTLIYLIIGYISLKKFDVRPQYK